MTGGVTTYNERSWAIDLIGHLKHLTRDSHRQVRAVGGEQTVRGDGSSLFPDVLLFGDRADAVVLQGWELKMPDTGIDDGDFRANAEIKARTLGLNSFVLWNVSYARLYALDAATDGFSVIAEWNELNDITNRADVKPARERWERVAEAILTRVNELLETGELKGRPFIEAYRSGGLMSLVLANVDVVAEALQRAARKDVTLKSRITVWWDRYGKEYGGKKAYRSLAQANLVNWIGKILFAHILRERDSRAAAVARIREDTSPVEALLLFEQISRTCNFWTIFCDSLGLVALPDVSWSHLRQFNSLLSDLNVGAVDQKELSDILEATASVGSRKLRGQYTTPRPLADLLVRLSVQNIEGRLLDPCCGSGTIARSALELKLSDGVASSDAIANVFAGDLDPQASQLATFALAKPSLMSHPFRLFTKDAFSLSPETQIELRDPNNGIAFEEQLGNFHAIVSNLPFVAQDGRRRYVAAISNVNQMFEEDLTGRADVAAYLPFALHGLLEPGGRLGIIITNAWLGTAWGDAFRKRLTDFYRLKSVVTSGAGRWFSNSKVITNILILEKPKADRAENTDDRIQFVVLKRPIEQLADRETVDLTAAQIELGQTHDAITVRSIRPSDLEQFAVYGLAGNAQFVDVKWILDMPLLRLKSLFTIRRGERRGWDRMFYPGCNHGIEDEYIRPVLLRSADVTGYVTSARAEAFSCSATLDELIQKGHTGALAWIERFAGAVNNKGKPLTESLARPGLHWYEMRADARTALFASINYGNRLYIGRLTPPAFVNQRLVRIIPKAGQTVNLDLCHALLNSCVGLFMLEGMGFGRGMGALDLNKDRIEDFMHMLDPTKLDSHQTRSIVAAFDPLRHREVMEVADELDQADRQAFDATVLEAFGQEDKLGRIYESLASLVSIRQAAT